MTDEERDDLRAGLEELSRVMANLGQPLGLMALAEWLIELQEATHSLFIGHPGFNPATGLIDTNEGAP